MKAPVLFISHGAPTFAIEPGALGPELEKLGKRIAEIRAVLVISPHWRTHNVKVMTTSEPETMHDFGGFAPELYQLRYPASGEPEIAARAALLLQRAGFEVRSERTPRACCRIEARLRMPSAHIRRKSTFFRCWSRSGQRAMRMM